jgi:hypothetical protein
MCECKECKFEECERNLDPYANANAIANPKNANATASSLGDSQSPPHLAPLCGQVSPLLQDLQQ